MSPTIFEPQTVGEYTHSGSDQLPGRHVGAASASLALVGDEEQLSVRLGLELRGVALATEVVTDPQRVAVQLVDGQDRLALVWAFGAGDVQLIRLRRRVQLDGPLIRLRPDSHCVVVVLNHELDGLADLVGELLPREFGRRRQPGALNCVGVLGVGAPGDQ